MLKVADIVHLAGGASAIARASEKLGRDPIKAKSIYRWPMSRDGIPHRYWSLLMAMSDGAVTVDDLHAANERRRASFDLTQRLIADADRQSA